MNTITEITRQGIIGCYSPESKWSGSLGDADFLTRLFDLKKMPSKDNRFDNAYRDIWQHRTYKDDWVDDWIFSDERFNLLLAPDDVFLKFLCETVHPKVRKDEKDAEVLVAKYNAWLKKDGWELFRKVDASDGHIFGARVIGSPMDLDKPDGWKKVDTLIQEMRFILRTAVAEGDYHNIVLISLDTMEAIAHAADGQNPVVGEDAPIETNAEERIRYILEEELKGDANKEALNYAKAALKLARSLQRSNNFDKPSAAMLVEATQSLENVVEILRAG